MKTFAASVAVWGALALAGLYLGAPHRLLYWSGVALVLFWIAVRHRLAVPPVRGPPPAAPLAHLRPPNRAQSTTAIRIARTRTKSAASDTRRSGGGDPEGTQAGGLAR